MYNPVMLSLNCLMLTRLHHSLMLQMVIIELCAAVSESQCSPSSEDTPDGSGHQYPTQSPANIPTPGMDPPHPPHTNWTIVTFSRPAWSIMNTKQQSESQGDGT